MAFGRDVRLFGGERFAGGDAQLPFDKIVTGDGFGDGVFDLQTGVHFQEVKAGCIHDEFHRAGADIVHGAGGINRGFAHCVAPGRGESGGGSFLNYFLMAALGGAVAFKQMDHVAERVTEDLHFDMARALQVFFYQHDGVAERGRTFLLGGGQGGGEIIGGVDHAHAAPAATGDSLDNNRVADARGLRGEDGGGLVGAVIPGQ